MRGENLTEYMEEEKIRYRLTKEETEIEKMAEEFVEIDEEERKEIEEIIEKTRRKKAITLRISENDLEKIKKEAEKEGIPYQTFITSILHKYITNQLIEEKYIERLKELFVK